MILETAVLSVKFLYVEGGPSLTVMPVRLQRMVTSVTSNVEDEGSVPSEMKKFCHYFTMHTGEHISTCFVPLWQKISDV